MRVILATHRTTEWLGVNKYFYLLAKHLTKLGVHVDVIVDSMYGVDALKEICGDSVEPIKLGPTALGPVSTARYCRNLAQYLGKDDDFDILHCGHVLPFLYLTKRGRRPVVFQPFGNELFTLAGNGMNSWYCRMAGFVLRFCGEQADVLLAEGDFQVGEMYSYYPGLRRLEILPVGVDMDNLGERATSSPNGCIRFLAVNSLLPYEGMDELIEAFRQVRARKILTIVGQGRERKKLKRLARGLPVAFKEDITEEELWGLYRSSDVFVCTTYETDVQMGVLEAMASGLPVISRKGDWLPDCVWSFEEFTELADGMAWMARSSASKRLEIGQRGVEEVRQYSFTGIAEKALEIYKGVVT